MASLFVILTFVVVGVPAFVMAFFPHVLPRLTNSYYSLIKMKTRVAEEDYEKIGVRLSGAVILVGDIAWLCYRISIGRF